MTEGSGAVGGRAMVGEASTRAPEGAATDVEATARAAVDDVAWMANPAAWAAGAGNEGLVSPTPSATGASGERPKGPVPGGGAPNRLHHRAAFCIEESLPKQEDDEAGERARREGAVGVCSRKIVVSRRRGQPAQASALQHLFPPPLMVKPGC